MKTLSPIYNNTNIKLLLKTGRLIMLFMFALSTLLIANMQQTNAASQEYVCDNGEDLIPKAQGINAEAWCESRGSAYSAKTIWVCDDGSTIVPVAQGINAEAWCEINGSGFSPPQDNTPRALGECQRGSILALPTWYEYLEFDENCTPQINSANDALPIGIAILEILLRLAGVVAVVFVVYGGFQYMISQGEPDKAKGARTTILNSLVGMLIVIIASVIVGFIARGIF